METKSPIEPDEQAIMTWRHFSRGADVHETNGLIYGYRLHCAVANIGDGGEAKRTTYRRVRELMRRHDRA